MTYLLILDAAPEPISTGIGITGLVLVAIVVVMITTAVLVGAVFLFRAIKKTSDRNARMIIGDASLNLDNAASQSDSRPQTSPNQP